MKIYTNEQIKHKIEQRKKRKRILKLFLYSLIAFLLICNVYLILQVIKNPTDTAQLFGYRCFSVASGSMEPTLQIGDLIITKEKSKKDIKVGDIISFKDGDSNITHRVIKVISQNGEILYQTKGDNNNVSDEKNIKYEDVEGVYVNHIPELGKMYIYIQKTPVVISILIIIYIIYKIVDTKENRKIARHEIRKKLEE
mgnify:FL=1